MPFQIFSTGQKNVNIVDILSIFLVGQWVQEDFFLLIQTLPTFWAERILILRILFFWIFWLPAWAQLGPGLGPGLGPPTLAHPLGPSWGPPTQTVNLENLARLSAPRIPAEG